MGAGAGAAGGFTFLLTQARGLSSHGPALLFLHWHLLTCSYQLTWSLSTTCLGVGCCLYRRYLAGVFRWAQCHSCPLPLYIEVGRTHWLRLGQQLTWLQACSGSGQSHGEFTCIYSLKDSTDKLSPYPGPVKSHFLWHHWALFSSRRYTKYHFLAFLCQL